MSNRFHSKWHRRNHHTYGNDTNPDASHDPIASQQQPFLGEFVLKGALSATCPLSSFAAFLYTDNTALCAYAGTRGAYIHSEGYLGLEVISTKSIGISANAPKIAIEALSPMRAISAWGGQIGLDVYSPTRAISAFGGRIGGEFYSPVRALSAYGGQIGLDVYSSSRGISSYGGFIGGEFYSPVRALSAWGGQIGLDVYSSNWGVNSYGNIMGVGAYSNNVALSAYGALTGIKAEGGNVAASFHSPMISLSTGGGGINVFNSRVGIYKVPQPYYPQQGSQVVLDVNGDVRIDGNATITGDLSALGTVNIGNNTAGASTTISGATTTLNGTVVSVNGTTVNVGSATTTTLNIGTLAGLTITEGSSTGDHVLNSYNLTAPNQVVNANSSVLNRIAGDTRYAPLVKNTTLGSVNTTTTLSNIVSGVALEAFSIYEITAVAVLSIAGNAAIVGSRVAFEGDGALSFYYHSIDEMSFNSASHTTHANITYSGVGTNNITIAPNLTLTVATNNTQHHYRRRMTIRTGLAGTLLWRHGVHTAGGTNSSTPALGSILFARKIS